MADTTGPTFTPVARATVSQQVRQQLHDQIRNGVMAPGTQVPSERTLSEQFQVARTSIREAIQGLVSMGLIERRGNRSFVVEQLPELTIAEDTRKTFVRELFETRRVLELPIFELAAARATDPQRAEITELAEAFDRDLSLAEFRRLDRRFHSTVATACGNPLLVEVHAKVLDALFQSTDFESLLYDQANRDSVGEIIASAGTDHRRIAEAIAAGDPVRALSAAEAHLADIEQRMIADLI